MSINFTRKTDYALVALASLAEAADRHELPRSARQIARQYGLPEPLLMNLLKRLHEVGLLRSRRGIGGGYWLAKAAHLISIAEVIEAIDGPQRLSFCCGENEKAPCMACKVAPRCPITGAVRRLNEMMVRMLRGVSIEDLRTQRLNLAVLRAIDEPPPPPPESPLVQLAAKTA